jgi:hypothetical protein
MYYVYDFKIKERRSMTDRINIKLVSMLRLCSISILSILMLVVVAPGHAENLLIFPDEHSFVVGYFDRQVDDRKMIEHDDDDERDPFDLEYNFFQVSFGVFEDLAVDLRLGEAEYTGYGSDSAWGVGIRAALFSWEDEGLAIGCGFQYDNYDPKGKVVSSGLDFTSDADEFNLSLDLTWRSCPYFALAAGVEYSEVSISYEHNQSLRRTRPVREGGYEQKDEIGFFLSAEAVAPFGLGVAGSLHFAADDSAKVGVFYKF